jgi:hypothetical protein
MTPGITLLIHLLFPCLITLQRQTASCVMTVVTSFEIGFRHLSRECICIASWSRDRTLDLPNTVQWCCGVGLTLIFRLCGHSVSTEDVPLSPEDKVNVKCRGQVDVTTMSSWRRREAGSDLGLLYCAVRRRYTAGGGGHSTILYNNADTETNERGY